MRYDKVQMQGKLWLHRVADVDTTRHRTGTDEGRLIYSRSDEKLYYGQNADWKKIVDAQDVITTGTKMLMTRFPIPDSWNIVEDNDDVTIIITNVSATVGDTGGTWIIDSMTGETGSHDHDGETGPPVNDFAWLGKSDFSGAVPADHHTHNIQSDGLHSHAFDGSWRPEHSKTIEVEYIL